MLRPQDSSTRERKSLNGLWRFRVDFDGVGRESDWWRRPLEAPLEMPVPSSYNDVLADTAIRDHVGEAWYQTLVRVPRGWDGQRVVLRFDAATHRAVVWVDDVEVTRHEGGYTPFEVDVTDLARPGDEVRITVVVDNQLTWETLPPGIVEEDAGRRSQVQFHDFFNYAGLHRSVWLYSTPATHVRDVTVVAGLEGATGTVGYRVEVSAGEGARVRATLVDATGIEVAQAEGLEGALRVADVHPWRPGEGYLYDLRVEVTEGAEVVDSYTLPVGIRTIEVRGNRFLINGEPFYFRGFGKHEDAAVRGKAHDDVLMVHDYALMSWIGANSFRTSHYPYAEEVLDYADRHGIVVIDETAAVGQNRHLMAGSMREDAPATFSPDAIGEPAQKVHAQAIRELVARDKNHPSVVLWSIANEPESHTEASEEYFRPLFELTRQLDPTRPVGFANMFLAPHGRDRLGKYADVLLINRYYGWYRFMEDLPGAEAAWQAELEAWASEGKPVIVSEYGADTLDGLHSVMAEAWTEEYQVEFLESAHRVFDRIDAVVGEHVWNFADFATKSGLTRVAANRKGVFTRDRRPKAAAFALRRRWHGR